ncbi:GNAT family N-acetyltransferase [Streptomyces sp. NPDC006487]|uniref:GNAT family N-acetyltransferase n=1 Tax=Streptomyces sp. NPDC006487 TaxID=3364748 RepID=UPI003696B5BE
MQLEFTEIDPRGPVFESLARPLYRALRPALSDAAFTAFAREGAGQGLVFTAARTPDGHCAALAAHRVLATSRGRVLFVDDLVADPELRGAGAGGALWEELVRRARLAGCARIELDSGVTNHGAHRFYHRKRMAVAAFHFSHDLARDPETT